MQLVHLELARTHLPLRRLDSDERLLREQAVETERQRCQECLGRQFWGLSLDIAQASFFAPVGIYAGERWLLLSFNAEPP